MSFPIHHLPFLFLVVSLFLPRLSLLVMYLQNSLTPFHLTGLIPPLAWLFLPRFLVLYIVYLDQGFSGWFVVHLIVLVLTYSGGGHYMQRRRRRDY
jgi:hypothetical protein